MDTEGKDERIRRRNRFFPEFSDPQGIQYVGPIASWFKKRIPLWFHYFPNEGAQESFWQGLVENKGKIFVVHTLEEVTKGARMVLRDEEGNKTVVGLAKDGSWKATDPISGGELVDGTLEGLVDQLGVKRGYTGV